MIIALVCDCKQWVIAITGYLHLETQELEEEEEIKASKGRSLIPAAIMEVFFT